MSTATPSFAQPAQDAKPAAAAPAVSGKNALLARIQAAKAKSQQTAAKPPPTPTADLLDFGAPTPAPAAAAAPSNDMDLLGGISAPAAAAAVPPPAAAAPAAAAPANNNAMFESLMATTTQPTPGPPAQEVAAPAPAPVPEIDEDILAALDPAEREALLREQRQIMEEFEAKKRKEELLKSSQPEGAAARAMAFNQRSSAAVADLAASMDGGSSGNTPAFAQPPAATRPAASSSTANSNTVDLGHGDTVPLHGKEQTDQAIRDGTALVVQCMSCNNWMQVTGEAKLMLCPVCGVVCPVEKAGAATTADMETAAQVAADQQLAEELQKEEYKRAAGERSAQRREERRAQGGAPGGQTWMDWIAGTPAPAPGGSSSAGGPTSPRSPGTEERQGLIGSNGTGGGARVAQQPQSLFACVAGSVAAAAEQMTGIQLTEDKEGNVHGVDSSSLLI